MAEGIIAVDLDGTLAKNDGWKGPEHIGAPIPKMVKRVEKWLKDGRKVVLFTARMAPPPKGAKTPELSKKVVKKNLETWLRNNVKGGENVDVIPPMKTRDIVEVWDDRAKQVTPNKGTLVKKSGLLAKQATILNIEEPKTQERFLKFLKRKDVVGHRTTKGKEVLDQGKILSSKELADKGLLKNVEGDKVGKRVKAKADMAKHTKLEVFASQGGLLKEKSYGDTGILATSGAAEPSPYLNEFTDEVVIPPTEAGKPRQLNIGKGYIVAPKKEVRKYEKDHPEYNYIPTEDIKGPLVKKVFKPTYSKLEVLKRWAPALAKGTAKHG